jgi:hypothetical protein
MKKFTFRIYMFVFVALCLLPFASQAHALDYDLSKLSKTDIAFIYLKLGFTHIIPLGFDHILFVLGLFLLSPKLKTVLWQATAFTIAHSITLGLGMYGVIRPPANIVEPVIALSILFVAIENMITDKLNRFRLLIVFSFGLIHGMGFASALKDLGLPARAFFSSLLTFNIGVELGQITVILCAYFLIGKWFGDKTWYRSRIVIPASCIIGLIACYWTYERIFLTGGN